MASTKKKGTRRARVGKPEPAADEELTASEEAEVAAFMAGPAVPVCVSEFSDVRRERLRQLDALVARRRGDTRTRRRKRSTSARAAPRAVLETEETPAPEVRIDFERLSARYDEGTAREKQRIVQAAITENDLPLLAAIAQRPGGRERIKRERNRRGRVASSGREPNAESRLDNARLVTLFDVMAARIRTLLRVYPPALLAAELARLMLALPELRRLQPEAIESLASDIAQARAGRLRAKRGRPKRRPSEFHQRQQQLAEELTKRALARAGLPAAELAERMSARRQAKARTRKRLR